MRLSTIVSDVELIGILIGAAQTNDIFLKVEFMNLAWNTGRFLLCAILVACGFTAAGCGNPLAEFSVAVSGGVGSMTESVLAMVLVTGSPDPAQTEDEPEAESPKAEDLVSDWQQPQVTLFVTGRQHGYIEPCGCTGLENQKGGLMRRHSVQKVLLERGWDLVAIDAGNQIRRTGQQPTIKMRKTFESLCRIMKYSVVGIGPDDLRTPSIDLLQTLLEAPEGDNPFTCANVVIEEMDDGSLTNKFQVIERNGRKIGVTMLLGDNHVKGLQQVEGIAVKSAAAGLADVVPKMKQAGCDLHVLVAHASLEQCRELAKQFPVFDLLVTAGGAGDPTLLPEEISAGGKTTAMIQVGVKGMYVGLVAANWEQGKLSLKYERVPLDDRFEDSPQMKKMFTSYQGELKNLWVRGALDDIRPRKHPSGNTFVGSAACADCHDEEYEIWAEGVDGNGGPHEKATRSLTNPGQRAWVQRHFDPECVSCHSTGWNPQEYYPYVSGFVDLKKHEALHGDGCENCHGPGSAHVAAENGDIDVDDATMEKLQQQMVVTLEQAREAMCMKCHDLDNSPDFVEEGGFDEYWPHIKHGGDD